MLRTAFSLVAALCLASPTLKSESRVFPPEAIDDAARLKLADFRTRHPGIDISHSGLTDEGFYVRYQHENLHLYFGPIRDLPKARQWRNSLQRIRAEVVTRRPSLEPSRVLLLRFSHQPVAGRAATHIRSADGLSPEDEVAGKGTPHTETATTPGARPATQQPSQNSAAKPTVDSPTANPSSDSSGKGRGGGFFGFLKRIFTF